jgi:hypothetical protein
MILKSLSDAELHESALKAAARDREAELCTIAHLLEVHRRRLHSARGFSSIFAYAVEGLGFSESAAATRVLAMRLLSDVPGCATLLESGELSVSSAASAQRFFRREERENRNFISAEAKNEIISTLAGKSKREVERALLTHSRNPDAHELTERSKAVAPNRTELTFYADDELLGLIERYRELKGGLKLEEILNSTLESELSRLDPLRRPEGNRVDAVTFPAKPDSRYVPVSFARTLHRRSSSRCEFIDPKSGRRCESRFRLQIDHVQPYGLGGPTAFDNLRLLCPSHNAFEARRTYGDAEIDQSFRQSRT